MDFQHLISVAQKVTNSVPDRPLEHRRFRHLINEIHARCGDLLLHNGFRWLSKGTFLFSFQYFFQEMVEILQDSCDIPPQSKDSRWLIDFVSLTDLTAKLTD
jgi:hypothetical protein